MIAGITGRNEALENAIEAAQEAHMHAEGDRPYKAATWAAVADSWSRIAVQMPELESTQAAVDEMAPFPAAAEFTKYPMAVTEDERETIVALRNKTAKVILNV